MRFDIITIFPSMFDSYFSESILKRAQNKKIISVKVHNLRNYTKDKHRNVDDTPYGGGAGMVMSVQPFFDAVNAVKKDKSFLKKLSSLVGKKPKVRTILFSAKGKRFTQKDVVRLSKYDQLIMLCGRYEGVDERVAENIADEEISIGDFVLTGGELPAMLVVDSVSRLLPGVLGNEQSAVIESHSEEGYLEFPQYTKPEDFKGWKVPDVLLSGHHSKIEKWRLGKTKNKKTNARKSSR